MTKNTPAAELSAEQLVALYKDLVLHRRFEEAAARAYGMGKIYGFCHLYIGQEALSAGLGHARRPEDIVISAYRIHAQALACGIEPQAVMDELFGKETGSVHGLGGSMHIFDKDKGFWGGWGLVGQQVPMAVGVAFAQKQLRTDRVTVCFFGDGAIHQGAIHEAFNNASIWDIPIVFVVENNKYGMGTSAERISSLQPFHEFAIPYKIEHRSFDGMDALESYDAFKDAIEWVRENQKPIFLEARCSRFRGHSMSDPGKYRTKEELAAEKAMDPIPKLRSFLLEKGYAEEAELDAMDKATKAEMKSVLKAAEAAPWPDASRIDEFTYAKGEA